MKIILAFLFLLSITSVKAQSNIIPTPEKAEIQPLSVLFKDTLRVHQGLVSDVCIEYLRLHLNKRKLLVELVEKDADLEFKLALADLEKDYILETGKKNIISFTSDEGAFHAINSFLQLLNGGNGLIAVQASRIEDSPKFEWRGLHLDVSRHFFSVEEIKGFLDIMALYKFNKFHWHLTDDQGWRIEIKKYPKLTEIGGFRDSTVIGHYSDSPRKYDTERYGGFYSQEDVKEIVAYAKTKFIDVVPEIEMPGHSRAALAAYPQFSCTGEQQPVPGLWGIFDDIYCSKSESIDFMKDILAEVLELFPSEYIHIGGDEAPKVRWHECEDCQKVIKNNDLKDEHELQSYFIRQIDAYLTAEGRKLIGWDEILEGGLSPNAAVMSWRGEKGGIEAAKQGHYVVMSPTTYCYFDYYQSSHDIEPLAIGGYLPLEKVYKYNPIPDEIPEEYKKYVLGGQANLWTEYMGSMDHVEYMAYPRALALIQSLWCKNKPEYDDFLKIYLARQEDYLKLNGVNYAKSIHYPQLKIDRAKGGINVHFEGLDEDSRFDLTQIMKPGTGFVDTVSKTISSSDVIFIPRAKIHDGFVDFNLSSEEFEQKVHYHFTMHSELGLNITVDPAPHPKYDNNGTLNLVDGIEGGESFKGSEWLGFREKQIGIVMDLEEQKSINLVTMGFMDNNGSWIYLPEEVKFFVSKDGEKWKKVKKVMSESEGEKLSKHGYFMNVKGKYLKIQVIAMDEIPAGKGGAGSTPWTFIDEIQILYGNEWK